MKSAALLNRIKELSFRANIEPVWNAKVCGTPVQLEFLELNYFSREEYGSSQIPAKGIKSATLLNRIKELSFRANIEPVWNVKVCGTPVQLEFLELNYFSREEYGNTLWLALVMKLAGFPNSVPEHLVEFLAQALAGGQLMWCEAEAKAYFPAGGNFHLIQRGGLGANLRGVHRVGPALDQIRAECVFDIRRLVFHTEQLLRVGLVLREQELRRFAIRPRSGGKPACAEVGMLGLKHSLAGHCDARLGLAALVFGPPTPGIAIPQRGQQMLMRRLGAAVGH